MVMDVDSILEDYRKIVKDREEKVPVPVPAEMREPVKEGQVREILFITPERCVITKEIEPDLFVVVPLTPHLALCPKDGLAVAIKRKRDGKEFIWGVIPSFAYIRREILENFSVVLDEMQEEDVIKILKFADTYDRKNLHSWKKRFLKLIMSRYASLMWASFIKHVGVEKQEVGVVYKLPDFVVSKILSEQVALAPAAQSKAVLEGKNWLGFVEEGKLVLYLPEDYEGKEVRIKYEQEVLFEGTLETPKLVIENLPKLNSYDFLEEKLNVELC